MASNPQKPIVPMPQMAVSMGLALVVIYVLIAHDSDRITAAVMVVCCAPFVLYWLLNNRSADGTHFVLDKHPAASLACWVRRGVIFCMVLAFFFGQPGQAEAVRSTALVAAGALLLLLLATPRWGSRVAPVAWAAVSAQFDMPHVHPWLFLGTAASGGGAGDLASPTATFLPAGMSAARPIFGLAFFNFFQNSRSARP